MRSEVFVDISDVVISQRRRARKSGKKVRNMTTCAFDRTTFHGPDLLTVTPKRRGHTQTFLIAKSILADRFPLVSSLPAGDQPVSWSTRLMEDPTSPLVKAGQVVDIEGPSSLRPFRPLYQCVFPIGLRARLSSRD